jgi:serine protease AprX
MPVSGAGNFSVVINDSGIDATHDDLNWQQNRPEHSNFDRHRYFNRFHAASYGGKRAGHGFERRTRKRTARASSAEQDRLPGGRYAGVAPGAKLIGTGSGAVLFILNAVGGFEWSIANQAQYGIRVMSNSFGSSGAFNPDNPLNYRFQSGL